MSQVYCATCEAPLEYGPTISGLCERCLLSDRERLAAEVTDYERSFALYDDAVRRGTALMDQAGLVPPLTSPVTARLVAWLVERAAQKGHNVIFAWEAPTALSAIRSGEAGLVLSVARPGGAVLFEFRVPPHRGVSGIEVRGTE